MGPLEVGENYHKSTIFSIVSLSKGWTTGHTLKGHCHKLTPLYKYFILEKEPHYFSGPRHAHNTWYTSVFKELQHSKKLWDDNNDNQKRQCHENNYCSKHISVWKQQRRSTRATARSPQALGPERVWGIFANFYVVAMFVTNILLWISLQLARAFGLIDSVT